MHILRSHLCRTMLSMVLCVLAPSTFAQWSRTAGPEGGYAEALLATQDYVLVGLEDGGVYRSTDLGATWHYASVGLTAEGAGGNCFAVLGPYVFVGSDRGVSRSTDQGRTWTAANVGFPPYGTSVSSFATIGSALFLGSPWYGVYVSYDSGATWIKKSSGLTDTTVMSLITDAGLLYAGTNGSGVFISSDNGGSWQPAGAGLGAGNAQRVYNLVSAGGTIVAGTRAGAYRSTDKGATWTVAATGMTSRDVSALGVHGTDFIAGTYGAGVYRSTNGGIDWSPSSNGWTDGNVRGFASAGGVLFAGNYGKAVVYTSTDNGSDWTASGSGITSKTICALWSTGSNVIAGTSDGLNVSTDGGASWGSDAHFLNTTMYGFASLGNRIYAATGGKGVFASTDQGASWFDANGNFPVSGWVPVYSVAADSPYVYIGAGAGVYRSSDNGSTWEPAKNGMTDSVAYAMCAANGTLFAGTSTLMYVSTNHGTTWSASTNGLRSYKVLSIVSVDGAVLAAYAFGGNPTVYKTTDNGQSWYPVSQGLATYSTTIQTLCVDGHNVFGGTSANGVWLSTDTGENWADVSNGLSGPGLDVAALTAAGGYLYAGMERGGVWKRPLSEMIVSVNGRGQPSLATEFRLEQNYPNPFNPKTVISGQWTADSRIRLVVYDILGRELAVLADGKYPAGKFTFTLDGTHLSSGVYLCRLTAGAHSAVMKMLLLR